ncbi:hypothetical protein H5410_064779, partial [Solanum commersonii]
REYIFTEEARKVELPEGFENELKGSVIVDGNLYGEYYYGSALYCLAYAPDQPMNGFLGPIVREWEGNGELVNASTIENVVRKLMASEEGNVIRKGGRRIWRSCKAVHRERGSSMEFDSFIVHITR